MGPCPFLFIHQFGQMEKQQIQSLVKIGRRFTPYEIGASWLGKPTRGIPSGMYIPSWAFGRTFNNGRSNNFINEQPFGLHMATFGSAFAMDVGRAYEEMKKGGGVVSWLAYTLSPIDQSRQIAAAAYKNFTGGMTTSRIGDQEIMQMVDAGLAFNLPYPPISGEYGTRKADVIIFVDASADSAHKGSELRKAAQYAYDHRLPFPNLDIHELDPVNLLPLLGTKKFEDKIDVPFRIFMSSNREAPLVIYLRFAKDDKDNQTGQDFVQSCMKTTCNTFNFIYPKAIADSAINMMKNNVILNEPALKRAIRQYHQFKTVDKVYTALSKVLAKETATTRAAPMTILEEYQPR